MKWSQNCSYKTKSVYLESVQNTVFCFRMLFNIPFFKKWVGRLRSLSGFVLCCIWFSTKTFLKYFNTFANKFFFQALHFPSKFKWFIRNVSDNIPSLYSWHILPISCTVNRGYSLNLSDYLNHIIYPNIGIP